MLTLICRRLSAWLLVGLLLVASMQAATPAETTGITIPYQKYVLSNGLTLLVNEDHKAPIVAVNVWYHVGSKNEKAGKTGFAHLFEHLMFNGSENFNDDYFQAMERIGATDLNGTTNEDRTNYFQNVPTLALDVALWMESDRMGHLLGAINQAKLDEQRGVVQNEKRQSENQPYGLANELIVKSTYPAAHPYSWTVIGSMEDLSAASLDDVKEWFKTYYGPANAVLVLAGDIDGATAKAKVEKYFGDIPSGPPVSHQENWTAKRTGTQRQRMEDHVPQSRLYLVWNIPGYGTLEGDYLNLVTDMLGSGKSSRFYKRLVYQDQIASSVNVYLDSKEIGSQLYIEATARPGEGLDKIEKALNEELARFLKDGPTSQELERAKTQYVAGFIRGIERIGGFGGKSDILAQNQVFTGDADHYQVTLKRVREATAADLQKAGQDWLSDGLYVLEVHPFPDYKATNTPVDRKHLPEPGTPPDARFPVLKGATLSNGMKVLLAERHAVPVVELQLLLDAGYASDQFGRPGTAKLAMNMLDEGTQTRNALVISDELALLGASLRTGSSLDTSFVRMSALKANLDKSLELFADVILNPSFPVSDFQRLQKQQLDTIQQEKAQPIPMGLRVLPKLLYGANHAYGTPFTGSGTTASVQALTREEMVKFHQTWFKANQATLIVAGDTTLNELLPKLEKQFAAWKGGETPRKNVATVAPLEKNALYLIDRPGSIQSILLVGELAPPKANPDEEAIVTMNQILGGSFTSRINMNLREDKHWTYGAGSVIINARGQRPFLAYTSVQGDKTKESIQEILKELSAIGGDKPITEEETSKARQNRILELPGVWETNEAVDGSLEEMVSYQLPNDYFARLPERLRSLNQAQLEQAARQVVHPNHLAIVVVGDRSKVEASLRDLNLGEIHFLDADGNPAR